jgi:hypothetical protein
MRKGLVSPWKFFTNCPCESRSVPFGAHSSSSSGFSDLIGGITKFPARSAKMGIPIRSGLVESLIDEPVDPAIQIVSRFFEQFRFRSFQIAQ